jgi:probable F420-dependent oxidoreductase
MLEVGVHLPQYGRSAGPVFLRDAARHAEALGFAHVWVSDHIVRPRLQSYPSPHLYDPLLALTWAAAATEHIALGTSVLVLPQYHPVWLANALAALDSLSEGRLIVGAGVGWSEAEFAALGQSFRDRGARTDEIIAVLRACWGDDPVSFHGRFYDLDDLLVLPKPAHRIPVWIGGRGDAAYRRAFALGDGFHAIGLDIDGARAMCARVRAAQPSPDFPISIRTGWDPLGMEHDQIRRERAAWSEAGVQHVVAAPWRTDRDSWMRSMEVLAELCELTPR